MKTTQQAYNVDNAEFGQRVQSFMSSFKKEYRKILYEPYREHTRVMNEQDLILRREMYRAAEQSTHA